MLQKREHRRLRMASLPTPNYSTGLFFWVVVINFGFFMSDLIVLAIELPLRDTIEYLNRVAQMIQCPDLKPVITRSVGAE